MECGICGIPQKRIYCGGCASHLTLRARFNVLNVTNQLAELQTSVTRALEGEARDEHGLSGVNGGNEARTVQLNARISVLQRRLDKIRATTSRVIERAIELQHQCELVREQSSQLQHVTTEIETNAQKQVGNFEQERNNKESVLENGYQDMLHLSLGLQSIRCQDLLEIFALKKKRKKNGYEIVLGFNVIPELTQLGHYSITTINSGLDRVSVFTMLLASYLGLRLPYEIVLPQKLHPKVLIGIGQEPLWLPHSVKTMMRSSSREFHHYCTLVAMLALDVTHVALKLGLPGINDLSDIVKLNQVVAQIYLRIESLLKTGHRIKIYSGTVQADLESLQDHLITAIDIEMNGKSAEWNIVEVPTERTK